MRNATLALFAAAALAACAIGPLQRTKAAPAAAPAPPSAVAKAKIRDLEEKCGSYLKMAQTMRAENERLKVRVKELEALTERLQSELERVRATVSGVYIPPIGRLPSKSYIGHSSKEESPEPSPFQASEKEPAEPKETPAAQEPRP